MRLSRLEAITHYLQGYVRDRLEAKARALSAINDRLTAGDQRFNAHQHRLAEHTAKLDRHAEKLESHDKALAGLAETKQTVDEVKRSFALFAGSRNVIIGLVAIWALATGKLAPDKLVELVKALAP